MPEKFPSQPNTPPPPPPPGEEFEIEHEDDPAARAAMYQRELGTDQAPSGAYEADLSKAEKATIEREAGGLDVQTTLQELQKKDKEIANASYEDNKDFYDEALQKRAEVAQEAVKHEYLKLRNKALYHIVRTGNGEQLIQESDPNAQKAISHDLGQLIEMIKSQKPALEQKGDTAKAQELADAQMRIIQLKEKLDVDLATQK